MSNEKFVSGTRAYLRGLARRRNSSTVTADDVQNYLTKKGFRGGKNDRLSIVRSVLQEPDFRPIGTVPSRRPEARSRAITAWATTA